MVFGARSFLKRVMRARRIQRVGIYIRLASICALHILKTHVAARWSSSPMGGDICCFHTAFREKLRRFISLTTSTFVVPPARKRTIASLMFGFSRRAETHVTTREGVLNPRVVQHRLVVLLFLIWVQKCRHTAWNRQSIFWNPPKEG